MSDLIKENTTKIIKETVQIKDEIISSNVNLREHYEIDSVDLARILYDLEQYYKISFSPRETSTVLTLDDLVNFIREKTSGSLE